MLGEINYVSAQEEWYANMFPASPQADLLKTSASKEQLALAAVEYGGTKVMVACSGGGEPIRLQTRTPELTIAEVVSTLETLQAQTRRFDAIGVASFGPIDLAPASPTYGRLLNTPKPGWAGADLIEPLAYSFGCPLALETDVNAAAVAEGEHGALDGADHAYITVGTGVGVGLVVAGRPLHGIGHPEAGHVLVRQRADDTFPGTCVAHGACLEGLISGPSLEARLGLPLAEVGPDHPCWDLAGDYLAQLCMTLVLTVAPARIVLGGGVGQRPELLSAASRHLLRHLAGYLDRYRSLADIERLLVPAALPHSGLTGALILAEAVLARTRFSRS